MNRHIPATLSARLLTVALATASLVVGAGTAYAYWEATGSGTGSASTGAVTLLTTGTVTSSPTNLLAPGGTGDLLVIVNNPNSQSVTVNSVALDPSGTLGIANAAAATCTASTAALSIVSSPPGLPLIVAAGATNSPVTLTNAVSMGNSDTGCQGATFTIPLLLTGQIG